MEKLGFLNHFPCLVFKASGASQQRCRLPSLWAPWSNGSPKGRCPGENLGSSANAGPSLHCTICKHVGRELAQSPPGRFQIPRNFYSQHGRPLDCKSFFFEQETISQIFGIVVTLLKPGHSRCHLQQCYWHLQNCTEHIIRKTVTAFWLWIYFSSKLQRWLSMATGCGKHTLRNTSELLTPY